MALVLAVFGLGLLVAAVPLASWVHELTASSLALLVVMVPFGLMGFVLAWRVPGNPIGPILLVLAVAEIFTSDAGSTPSVPFGSAMVGCTWRGWRCSSAAVGSGSSC